MRINAKKLASEMFQPMFVQFCCFDSKTGPRSTGLANSLKYLLI